MLACCSLLGLLGRCQRVIFQKWGASKQPCRQATVSQTEIPATNTSRHAFHGPADWAERINQQMAVFPCLVPDPQTLLLLASLQGNGVRVCICFTTFLPNACGMLIKVLICVILSLLAAKKFSESVSNSASHPTEQWASSKQYMTISTILVLPGRDPTVISYKSLV